MEMFRAPQEKGGNEWRIIRAVMYDTDEVTPIPQEKPKRTGYIETTPLPRVPDTSEPRPIPGGR